MAKDDKKVKRGIYLYIDGKGITNDINSISNEIKGLQRDIKNMTIGSEEYNRTMAKIKHLQGILKEHRQEIRGVTEETKKSTLSLGKLADGFNRFGGVIVSIIGFLTGFALALRSIREERNKLEESQAGLKALTGLDDESISWLTDQAKTLSTTMTKEGLRVRQSAAEILDAFMLVGSAKPELLGDKEALRAVTEEAMRLQAAAGDITLNEAVDSLTLSLNQYGAAADQASRFVNVLAAGSKEGAVNIASQAKAIQKAGTMAATLNIPIEELVGSIEMLGEKGVKDEIAGTGLKTFFTRLATGATDTNPKVVGLANALDNLNKQVEAAEAKQAGGGTSLLKKIFGDEGMQTAMILTQNVEQVKKYTEAVTGTNIAYEQAAINSATAAAQLDQSRNKMKLAAIELGEKLNPVLTVSTNMMTNVVKILPGLIDWFQKWGGTIVALLVPVAAYVGYLKLAAMYHTTLNAVTKVAATLKVLYAVATANVAGNLTGANKILSLFSANMVKNATVLRVATAATYLFAAAKAVLTGNIKAARIAMAAFNTVCTKNIYVAIAVAVVALATAIYKLATRTTEAEKAANDYQKRIYAERTELRKLTEAAQRAGDGTQRRKELIDEINSKYGQYLTNLLTEHSSLEDIKRAYNEINLAMQRNIAQKVLDEKTEEINRDMIEDKISQMNDVRDILSHSFLPDAQVNEITQKIDLVSKKYAAAGKSAEYIAKSLDYGIKKIYFQDGYAPRDLEGQIKDYAKLVLEEYGKVKKVQDSLAAFVPGVGQTNEIPEVVITGTAPEKKIDGNDGEVEKESEKKKRIQKELERIETDHMQQMTHLQKLYLEGEIKTDEEYTALQIDLEKKTLDEKLRIAGLEPHDREKLQVQMLEAQIKFNQECKKQDEKEDKERQKSEDKNAKDRLSIRKRQLRIELEEAASSHFKNFSSEEDYAKEVNDIRQRYWQDLLGNYKLTEEERTEITQEQAETQADIEQKKYEKMMELNSQYAGMVEDIASNFGETIGEMIANGELTMKGFLKETVLMALDALERVIEITCLEVMVKNLAATAPLSFIGAAKAALQIAAIKASFALVKGLVGNFYTGGYTGSGDWDQPQGIVHSNEFVANRYAVANPAVRPVLDLIDSAQRTGSVGNISQEDMAAVAGVSSKHKAGSVPNTKYIYGNRPDDKMADMMKQLAQVLDKLKTRLDEPLISETYVTGKRGINQAMKEYNVLQNNISRRK